MSQTDSISYIPLLFWFIILFILIYKVVFTELLYIIIITFKVRHQTYTNYNLNSIILFKNIIDILNLIFSSLKKIKQMLLTFYLFNLIGMKLNRYIIYIN